MSCVTIFLSQCLPDDLMIRKLFYFLKLYFGFSRRESRGFLLVFPVLVLLYFIPVIYNRIIKFSNLDHYRDYSNQVDIWKASGRHPSGAVGMDTAKADFSKTAEQDTLKNLSIYRKPKAPEINFMDFSDADSIVLQVVPGIGQVLAGRIIKYRESLGGFYQEQQLMEVYGVTEEVAQRVFEYFSFTPEIHHPLKINAMEAGELAEHPYINYGPAKVIVAYRKQHGHFETADDLLKIKIFNEAWLERVRPYLAF